MNIFEAFSKMNKGETVKDCEGVFYKKVNDKLVESHDEGFNWKETEQLTVGSINANWTKGNWSIVK